MVKAEAEAAPRLRVLRPHRPQRAGEVPERSTHAAHQESHLANYSGEYHVSISSLPTHTSGLKTLKFVLVFTLLIFQALMNENSNKVISINARKV